MKAGLKKKKPLVLVAVIQKTGFYVFRSDWMVSFGLDRLFLSDWIYQI